MKILDLFSGSQSLKQPSLDLGHEYFSVDIDASSNPDMIVDIKTLEWNSIPFSPDIIWASPPCTCFSVSSIGKHWNKDHTPKTQRAIEAKEIVKNTLFIIEQMNPKYYFMENPRGKLRKLDIVQDIPIRYTVTYCQYGDKRMKPTDIWTNCDKWIPRPMCNYGDPCHISAPRGSQTGTQGMAKNDKWKVPYELLYEILVASEIK